MTTTTPLEQSKQRVSPNAPGTDAEHTPVQEEAGLTGGFLFGGRLYPDPTWLNSNLRPVKGTRYPGSTTL